MAAYRDHGVRVHALVACVYLAALGLLGIGLWRLWTEVLAGIGL